MKKINLNNLELTEFTGKNDPGQHCQAAFPLFGAHGTKSTATVYFELEPGDSLGRHSDSAEELLLALDGDVEVEIGGETGSLSKGEIALVPKMIPHNLTNSGKAINKMKNRSSINRSLDYLPLQTAPFCYRRIFPRTSFDFIFFSTNSSSGKMGLSL